MISLAGGVSPFGHPRINDRSHLPAAFRSVPRPSSPPGAKASTERPSLAPDLAPPPARRTKSRPSTINNNPRAVSTTSQLVAYAQTQPTSGFTCERTQASRRGTGPWQDGSSGRPATRRQDRRAALLDRPVAAPAHPPSRGRAAAGQDVESGEWSQPIRRRVSKGMLASRMHPHPASRTILERR